MREMKNHIILKCADTEERGSGGAGGGEREKEYSIKNPQASGLSHFSSK